MIDIAQPVSNTLVFSTIAILLLATAIGIGFVQRAKKKMSKEESK